MPATFSILQLTKEKQANFHNFWKPSYNGENLVYEYISNCGLTAYGNQILEHEQLHFGPLFIGQASFMLKVLY